MIFSGIFLITLLDASSSELVHRRQSPCTDDWSKQVKELRELFETYGIDGYVVPSEDAHLSEYVAPEYARRYFISGLKGSAGEAIVLKNGAALKTDSRYCDSIPNQMDCNWETFCPGSTQNLIDFAAQELGTGAKIGADPFLFTESSWNYYHDGFGAKNIHLIAINENLVDVVWDKMNRPANSKEAIFIHDDKYAGKSVKAKIDSVKRKLTEENVDYLIVSRLDSIAWLLNLRGLDIPYSPVFISYVVVKRDGKTSFYPRDGQKITNEILDHLSHMTEMEIDMDGYGRIAEVISNLSGTVWVPATGTTYGILNSLSQDVTKVTSPCPIEYEKSIKNEVEQIGMIRSGLYDSVACAEVLMWTENQLKADKPISEMDVVYKVAYLRNETDPGHYKGESFDCIAASGPNAANNHYSPTEETSRAINKDETFLLDNGGQYLDGTTDVTRTIYIPSDGKSVPEEIKNRYTRVLQGNMHLGNAKFPRGTPGYQMEPFARQPLFQDHQKYGHGTGHGIGYFLLVHELPNGIGSRASSYNYAGFEPGMVESIEPGFYVSGEYGIRIEDDALVVDEGDDFIGFLKMSLVPYETNLINFDLMTESDMNQLVRYHDKCRETSKLARELGKREVAEWIDLRIEEGESQQASKNKINSAQSFSLALPIMVSILLSYVN